MFVGGLNPHIISRSMFGRKGQVMSSPSQTARLRPIKTLVPTSQGNKKVSVGQVGQVGQVIGLPFRMVLDPRTVRPSLRTVHFAGLKFDASFFPTCQVRASRF